MPSFSTFYIPLHLKLDQIMVNRAQLPRHGSSPPPESHLHTSPPTPTTISTISSDQSSSSSNSFSRSPHPMPPPPPYSPSLSCPVHPTYPPYPSDDPPPYDCRCYYTLQPCGGYYRPTTYTYEAPQTVLALIILPAGFAQSSAPVFPLTSIPMQLPTSPYVSPTPPLDEPPVIPMCRPYHCLCNFPASCPYASVYPIHDQPYHPPVAMQW